MSALEALAWVTLLAMCLAISAIRSLPYRRHVSRQAPRRNPQLKLKLIEKREIVREVRDECAA